MVAVKLDEGNAIIHNYRPKVLKSSNVDERFHQLKKVTVRVPLNIQTNMECLICHVKIKRSLHRFKQHLVWKHIYPLWAEVGPNEIRCQDCDFVAVSRMKLIWHLAIEHGQFELKLKESNQTISDYGAAIAANTKWLKLKLPININLLTWHQSFHSPSLATFPEKVSDVECEWLSKERHAHPLVPAVQDLLLVIVTPRLRPHPRVRVRGKVGQREGGVGPAKRVEDASHHSL